MYVSYSYRWLAIVALTAFTAFLPTQLYAVETAVSAQYRPRVELDRRFGDFASAYATHRARIGIDAKTDDWNAYVEVQDVRGWGSEANTAIQEARVDIHQSYVQWAPSAAANLRVGRQEIIFLNHRLIGSLDWAQQARSFDALRFYGKQHNVFWDVFAAPLTDGAPKRARDGVVGAANLRWVNAKRTVAAVAVADSAKNKKLFRWTVGPYSAGPVIGDLSYEVEGYYQSSSAGGKKFKAYLYHGELGYQLKTAPVKPGIRAGYDAISGKTKTYAPFDTLYATNHKFYGFMDFFLALPKDTGGNGLRDAYVALTGSQGAVSTVLSGHRFFAGPGSEGVFGNEIDSVTSFKINPQVALEGGGGVFFKETLLSKVRKNVTMESPFWAYSMLTYKL